MTIPRIILIGDEEEASYRAREGIRQLSILKELMEFQNLEQDVRRVRYTDGSEITCRSVFGVEEIKIFAPSVAGVRGEYVFLAGVHFSGADGRILRSVDLGESWKMLDDLDPEHEGYVDIVYVSYLEGGICLAGSAYEGMLFRSIDFGETWVYTSIPVNQTSIHALTNVENGICLAGTPPGGYILRSTNFGATWVNVKTTGATDVTAIGYLEKGICLAGIFIYPFAYILRSTDFGLTWTDAEYPKRLESYSPQSFLYLGDGICLVGMSVFSGGYNRIWRSTDYGESWVSCLSGSGSIYAGVYFGKGVCLFGGEGGTFYRSEDYGLTWKTSNISEDHVNSLAYINSICLAGTSTTSVLPYIGKIFKSVDFGLTWEDLEVPFDIIGVKSLAAMAKE